MPETKTPSYGRWQVGSEIGRGAYGVVYLATGPAGARVAVKVCRRSDVGDERYERELRGAKLYSSIPPQEGLVRMREFVEEPWGFYAVMDLADDEFGRELSGEASYRPRTLASVIDGEKALPLGECVKLGWTLAKGLAALQRHHLLHRDIKPGNVIYVGGRPVLSDPGLVVEESKAASLVGTLGYDPPEGFTDAAGDIYSLGRTLKAASFGRRIEDLDKGPALEADTGAKLFPAWWRILNKATDPTPSRRYQSAKALIKDLDSLRRKMALASIVGTRVAKVVIAVLALAAIAILVRQSAGTRVQDADIARQSKEIEQLRKFKTDTEKMFARSEHESLWPIFIMTKEDLIGFDNDEDLFKSRIDDVAKTNQVRAAELRSLVAKIHELDRKDKALMEKIRPLYKIGKEKLEKDLDDGAEYQQAKKLHFERCDIGKERDAIRKELLGR